jgi:hypothetical protein
MKKNKLNQKIVAVLLVFSVVVWLGSPVLVFAEELPPEEPNGQESPPEVDQPPTEGTGDNTGGEEGSGEEGSTEESGSEQGPTEEDQTNNEESDSSEGSEEGSNDEGQSSEEEQESSNEENSGEETSGQESTDETNTGNQDTGANEEGSDEESNTEEETGDETSNEGEEGLDEGDANTEGETESQSNPGEEGTEADGAQGGEGGEGGEGEQGGEGEPGANSGDNSLPSDGEDGENTEDGEDGEDGDNNEGDEEGGDAVIVTGDAQASVNVINVVNTNIIGSYGMFLLLNIFSQMFGDIDLRLFNFEPGPDCPEVCSNIENLNITNNNTGTITNDVEAEANTGNNSASGNAGDATILTGDAEAGANIVNLLNTNIVGSNYLVLTLNNFEDWSGDLVLPGKLFFEALMGSPLSSGEEDGISDQELETGDQGQEEADAEDSEGEELDEEEGADTQSGGGNVGSDVDVENNNDATVGNDVGSSADTGQNEANDNDGGSTIVTGDADASTNIVNQVNTNLFGGSQLYILIKVHGDWAGDIFSLPGGASWSNGPEGISIFGLGPWTGGGVGIAQDVDIENNNDGTVENNINVSANTGNNEASGNDGEAFIGTGDAEAAANVVNIVNTNIIGQNWLFALINIFGDWEGDIAFGRPDLWIGGTANVNPASPGGAVEYQMTIYNAGDTDATGVRLSSIFDKFNLRLKDAGDASAAADTEDNNELNWDLGTIPMGESVTISYTADIESDLPYGSTLIENTATVTSYEDDENDIDNTESLAFEVFNSNTAAPGGPGHYTVVEKPQLELYKWSSATGPVRHGEIVDFEITLENTGRAPAYEVETTDWILDSEDNIIKEQKWNLQEVVADEEIYMDYTLEINGNAPAGTYRAITYVTARDGQNNFIRTEDVIIEFEVIDDVAAGAGKEITIETIDPVEFAAESVLGAVSGTVEAETKFIDEPLILGMADLPAPVKPEFEAKAVLAGFGATIMNAIEAFPLPAAVLALEVMLIALLFFAARREDEEKPKKPQRLKRRR